HGVDAWLQETAQPDRPNVIGRVSGGPGPTLMLNAHLDTVGVGGMDDPFTPRIDAGRIHGRGAVDTKGGLAALMAATVRAAAAVDGTVLFTGVADEEHGSVGSEAVAVEFTADA
ncbi:MAG: M20/M25/M40 family metallo-hydrolase, partial [Actinobacteria bacterium]|nr:M20/M25/M40 family metallo-hydrolase [Actinomycetota bacterium]NIS30694.1 M20/M25/M40 family metallo-hydrolase [Actinomycetota bacterium]NIT95229.1 M20/M25/M40 family metallo-hydrolase [Actinomycetota bacterium]NIU18908.1 M20/M25/M40 family metallo-hydrolase [Actinomycetota bacterium]NIU65904.1 M20/M25/M40 family metallo-hydrolase [Actinomycetota bacterium]